MTGCCVTGCCVTGCCMPGCCMTGCCVTGCCVTGCCVTGSCVTGSCEPEKMCGMMRYEEILIAADPKWFMSDFLDLTKLQLKILSSYNTHSYQTTSILNYFIKY